MLIIPPGCDMTVVHNDRRAAGAYCERCGYDFPPSAGLPAVLKCQPKRGSRVPQTYTFNGRPIESLCELSDEELDDVLRSAALIPNDFEWVRQAQLEHQRRREETNDDE